jgi:SPP1 gp7 family putative phage head morphogenesis protein
MAKRKRTLELSAKSERELQQLYRQRYLALRRLTAKAIRELPALYRKTGAEVRKDSADPVVEPLVWDVDPYAAWDGIDPYSLVIPELRGVPIHLPTNWREDGMQRRIMLPRYDKVTVRPVSELIGKLRLSYVKDFNREKEITRRKLEALENQMTGENRRKWRSLAREAGGEEAVETILEEVSIREEEAVPDAVRDRWVQRQMDLVGSSDAIREGTSRFPSLLRKHTQAMEAVIKESVTKGRLIDDTIKKLRQIDGISARRAELIATDQALTHNAKMNEIRQEKLGVTHYIWTTVGDQRVRKLHQQRSGNRYASDHTFSATPDDGPPGVPIACRCWRTPDLKATLEAKRKAKRK